MDGPLPDVLEEARRILAAADREGVILRLVGGIAVRLTSPSAAKGNLVRAYKDVDLVGRASQTREIRGLFESLGYAPREAFNAVHAGRRMIFLDAPDRRRVDIFLDYFEMCHRFDLRNRLGLRKETLPLADLLATKLQIVQPDERDYKDMVAILADHELGGSEREDVIDVSRVAGLCAGSWGVYKTFEVSLQRVAQALPNFASGQANEAVERRVKGLLDSMEAAPKPLRWRLRSKVGERLRWYEVPEAGDVA